MQYPQPDATKPDQHRDGSGPLELDDEGGMIVAWIIAAIAFYLVIVVVWAAARATGLI